MLKHHDVIKAAVPHLSRAVSAAFQLKVYFPVSYTHLDVYKRQGTERRGQAAETTAQCPRQGKKLCEEKAFFTVINWTTFFLIHALTMKSVADEKKNGTLLGTTTIYGGTSTPGTTRQPTGWNLAVPTPTEETP